MREKGVKDQMEVRDDMEQKQEGACGSRAYLLAEQIRKGNAVRENLSQLRQVCREDPALLQECAEPEFLALWEECLGNEDPKARKNAALFLGDLAGAGISESGEEHGKRVLWDPDRTARLLWECCKKEETLFVRSSYLKALAQFPEETLDAYAQIFSEELERLQQEEIAAEDAKHIRQEKKALEELVSRTSAGDPAEGFCPAGMGGVHRVMLTADPAVRPLLAKAAARMAEKTAVTPFGVAVTTDRLADVLQLRLYREVWFVVRQRADRPARREDLAGAVAASELLPILRRFYPDRETFSFRVRMLGMEREKRKAQFVEKLAFDLEEASGHRLVNRSRGYEAGLILREKQDGTFRVFVRIMGMEDGRFAYCRHRYPTSMHPAAAAAMAALAQPYLKQEARVLDPFCGVGTLLVERDRLVKTKWMYVTDIYGDAIRDGRENAARAGEEIYFVNRDYFDFTSEHLFDEIICEFPRALPGQEEPEEFYRRFFAKSLELLDEGGRMIFLSQEEGQVKKYLRLRKELRLIRQIDFREREAIYVVEKRM